MISGKTMVMSAELKDCASQFEYRLFTEKSIVVYKFVCARCQSFYIGETNTIDLQGLIKV